MRSSLKSALPQEIEVWYVLPALRREFTKSLISDYGLAQKEAAKLLGLTESAISQYLKLKRAKEVQFTKEVLGEIKQAAGRMVKNNHLAPIEFVRVSQLLSVKKAICKIHQGSVMHFDQNCEVCLGGTNKALEAAKREEPGQALKAVK